MKLSTNRVSTKRGTFPYYSPTAGRWLSRDPAGEQAGGLNIYAAMRNQPARCSDAVGLAVDDPSEDSLDWYVDNLENFKGHTARPISAFNPTPLPDEVLDSIVTRAEATLGFLNGWDRVNGVFLFAGSTAGYRGSNYEFMIGGGLNYDSGLNMFAIVAPVAHGPHIEGAFGWEISASTEHGLHLWDGVAIFDISARRGGVGGFVSGHGDSGIFGYYGDPAFIGVGYDITSPGFTPLH